MTTSPRVLSSVGVVDDSPICRSRLRTILEADGDLLVASERHTGQGVVAWLERVKPTVLVTDLVMPGVDGLCVVRDVMRTCPLPIVVVSAGGFSESSAYEATRMGALEVAKKPTFGDTAAEHALRAAVRRVAQARVVRHPGAPLERAPSLNLGLPAALGPRPRVLGIGSSAGGPPAVAALLGALAPGNAPAILVAQHMPKDHADDFAAFLARRCSLTVEVCRGTSSLAPGKVIVPGDGMDLMLLSPERVGVVAAQSPLTPSVDVLFSSLAKVLGAEAAGAILSGIGKDGAAGLAEMRKAGSWTMAQDEASCAVFGMPKAAAGSARWHLAPSEMAALMSNVGFGNADSA